MNTRVSVNALKHIDVRQKEQYYLKISNGGNEVLINVGKKTYDAVTALQEETQATQSLTPPKDEKGEAISDKVDSNKPPRR